MAGVSVIANSSVRPCPAPDQKTGRGGPDAGAIKLGFERPQQFGFPGERRQLIRAFLQFNPHHLPQQTKMAASHPIRVGHPIMAQPLPQILGFPHIKHHLGGILHQIDAGAIGQLPEKILAQPLDERPRIRKQQCL